MQTATSTDWLTLSDWTLMAVTGPQAKAFLQGQVTCDIRELTPGESRLGAHCDPKGRMQVSFRALATGEEQVLLRLPRSMVEATTASLGKYIVFSKAELSDETGHYLVRGLCGPDARKQLAGALVEPAPEPGQWVAHDGGFIVTLDEQRYECWLTEAQAEVLDRHFGQPTAGDTQWRLLDIRAGLGEVLPQTLGLFTPQLLNFTQIGGVSFRKGCFTGQEIVARLHYKGKLKQRMRRLSAACSDPDALLPGTLLHNGDGKKIGELVTAAPSQPDTCECLAVIEDSALEGDIQIDHTFPAEPLSLPYTVE